MLNKLEDFLRRYNMIARGDQFIPAQLGKKLIQHASTPGR